MNSRFIDTLEPVEARIERSTSPLAVVLPNSLCDEKSVLPKPRDYNLHSIPLLTDISTA